MALPIGLAVGKRQGKSHDRNRGRRILKRRLPQNSSWIRPGVWIVAGLSGTGMKAGSTDVYEELARLLEGEGFWSRNGRERTGKIRRRAQKKMTPAAWVGITLVRGYQLLCPRSLGHNCRFYPTCSQYAIDAISVHGFLKGSFLAVKRLCKCAPWHPGGYDPYRRRLKERSRGLIRTRMVIYSGFYLEDGRGPYDEADGACSRLHRVSGVGNHRTTLIVRLLLHPLTKKQMTSMQKMQKLQPRIKMLQEKFKDDKESLNREMMALCKENKVNPAAGCLPLLVQLPVFILLYQVLTNYDFSGVSFLWIRLDGSVLTTLGEASADCREGSARHHDRPLRPMANPYALLNVSVYLPNLLLLLGIGFLTWYQQQLTASGNPQMAMMNWFMPLFLTFICLSLPGGVLCTGASPLFSEWCSS